MCFSNMCNASFLDGATDGRALKVHRQIPYQNHEQSDFVIKSLKVDAKTLFSEWQIIEVLRRREQRYRHLMIDRDRKFCVVNEICKVFVGSSAS